MDDFSVSFVIIAYNQERFIREAIQGAWDQSYSPLEIVISDDCSADRTFDIIREEASRYRGPHRVKINRNPKNLGLCGHINRIMELATGGFIVIAAGDDISVPERVARLVEVYREAGGRITSIFTNGYLTDDNGQVKSKLFLNDRDPGSKALWRIAWGEPLVWGGSHAWDRRLFEVFGPISEERPAYEDVAISFRSALIGKIRYLPEPFVYYRQHDGNLHLRGASDDPDRNVEQWLKWQYKYAETQANSMLCHLDDLDVAERKFPERKQEFMQLRRTVEQSIRQTEDKLDMLRSSSSLPKAIITLRFAFRGVSAKRLAQWVLTFYFPRFYLRWMSKKRDRLRLRNANVERQIL
jgi:glycosyltransferase involved in cell wall biosynthesis